MNNIFRICSKLACACAAAAFLCGPALADDPKPAQEGKGQAVTVEYLKQQYAAELAALNQCAKKEVFLSPGGLDAIKALADYLAGGLMPYADVSQTKTDPVSVEIRDRYNLLKGLNDRMEKRLWRVLDYIVSYKLPVEYYRLLLATDYLCYSKENTEILVGFDKAYGEFMKLLGEMERNRVCNVTASELMMASGLDRYYSVGGYMKGSVDRRMRVMGDYLLAIRPGNMEKLRHRTQRLGEFLDDAGKKVFELMPVFEKEPGYENIKPLIFGFINVIEAAFDLNEQMVKLIDAVDSGKAHLGKIRGNSLDENGAFHIDYAGKPGLPGYIRQARRAFNKCREEYMKVAARLNREDGCRMAWE